MISIIIVGRTNAEEWWQYYPEEKEKVNENIRSFFHIPPSDKIQITYIDPDIVKNSKVNISSTNTSVIYKKSYFEDYIDEIPSKDKNLFHYIIYDYSVPLDITNMNRISELLVPDGKMYIPGVIIYERILSPEEKKLILCEKGDSSCIKVSINTHPDTKEILIKPDTTYGDLKAYYRTSRVDGLVLMLGHKEIEDAQKVSKDAKVLANTPLNIIRRNRKLANDLDTSNFSVTKYDAEKEKYPIFLGEAEDQGFPADQFTVYSNDKSAPAVADVDTSDDEYVDAPEYIDAGRRINKRRKSKRRKSNRK